MRPSYSKFFGGAVTVGAVFDVAVAVTGGLRLARAPGAGGGARLDVVGRRLGGRSRPVTRRTASARRSVSGSGVAIVCAVCVGAPDVACTGIAFVVSAFGPPVPLNAKTTPTAATTSSPAPPAMNGRRFRRAAATCCVVPHAVPPVPIFGFDADDDPTAR